MAEVKGKQISKKTLILETAKDIFSQKGYDDSSMDEIALKAGVPKSLIYYHFKSKDELLQEVISNFFKEYENLLSTENTLNDCKYLQFLDQNSDFLRVIVIESIKKNDSSSYVFKVVELLMEYESKITGNENLAEYKKSHERWVVEFFTSIVPGVLFACYKEKWCNHFNTDKTALEQDFLSAYNQTHGAYHRSILERKSEK